ncbi:MAG: S1C family serine protease [Spirochaetaceae bacterium]|jgi:S1-C subfamily serine protease|nr:S1C family serine protease [Spirochaetaceae bacterium]
MKKKFFTVKIFAAFILCACNSYEKAERRLEPPKSALEVRIGDIEKTLETDPAKAIHLCGVFTIVYGTNIDTETAAAISSLRSRALDKLKESQSAAIAEKRWEDAASLARSLAALGVSVKNTGAEPDFLLSQAKEYLNEGKNLPAFIFAFRSNELSHISAEDALLFLSRAVEQKQRGAASYFLKAAETADAEVPEEHAAFARHLDNPQDMVKGVATVLVDRGMKIERGMGTPDRILGSAFFIDSSGLLITNYHVIASEVDPAYNGYSRMYIRTGNSSSARVPATVVGWDKTLDLALIKTKAGVVKPEYVFSVIDHASPKVGDTILAIGSPGGLEKTVTSGIVSALGRRFLQIGDVIQMDAAVNHGNSGGPVVDSKGRLVGIVFAGIEQFQGLNFAVPAGRLASALPALIKGGKSARPWLGITVAETRGEAEIIYVAPRTPASDQLLQEGVFLESLNGQKTHASQGALIPALQDRLFACRPGELVAVKTKDGKTRIMQTAERPAVPLAESAKLDSRERMTAPLFGLVLEPSVAGSLVPSYLIKKVVRGSVADEAGCFSAQDLVSIRGFRVEEKDGYALLDINVKQRRAGYFETSVRLPASLDSPDTL